MLVVVIIYDGVYIYVPAWMSVALNISAGCCDHRRLKFGPPLLIKIK